MSCGEWEVIRQTFEDLRRRGLYLGPVPSFRREVSPSSSPARDLRVAAGTVLLAPHEAGGMEPRAELPSCWCCHAAYRLDWLREEEGRAYAWLLPSCGCLDVPQALACCGSCSDHCQCRRREGHEP